MCSFTFSAKKLSYLEIDPPPFASPQFHVTVRIPFLCLEAYLLTVKTNVSKTPAEGYSAVFLLNI